MNLIGFLEKGQKNLLGEEFSPVHFAYSEWMKSIKVDKHEDRCAKREKKIIDINSAHNSSLYTIIMLFIDWKKYKF